VNPSLSGKNCSKLHTLTEAQEVFYGYPMRPRLYSAPLLLPLLLSVSAYFLANAHASDSSAPAPHVRLTVDEVVSNMIRRNLQRAQELRAYQGTRTYRLEYRGFPGNRTAEMIVDVKYQSPGTKEFTVRSETGSKLVIERVFKKLLQSEQEALTAENQSRVALNRDNYAFAMLGCEQTPTGSLYVLSVEPLVKSKLLYRGKIWVDAQDFAVARIEGEPAKNPSFWTKDTKIEQVYGRVGDFWLPVSNRSSSSIRLGGHADFSIDYKDYQITSTAHPREHSERVAGNR
jgi:hypothetical protein